MINNPVIFIMGVAGSGKTTIGKMLSAKIGIPFFDGDDFHTAENKEKMRMGIPLTDEDRKDWLITINQVARGQSKTDGAIIACSALKQKYRQILSDEINAFVYWFFLHGSYELISNRMQARENHYMPVSLLQSQFDILEIPVNAIAIDISTQPEEIVEQIISHLK